MLAASESIVIHKNSGAVIHVWYGNNLSSEVKKRHELSHSTEEVSLDPSKFI